MVGRQSLFHASTIKKSIGAPLVQFTSQKGRKNQQKKCCTIGGECRMSPRCKRKADVQQGEIKVLGIQSNRIEPICTEDNLLYADEEQYQKGSGIQEKHGLLCTFQKFSPQI